MSRALAWEDLWDCPRERPFWCSHPHCLWCNWDDEDHDGWTLAAFLGPTLPFERHYDPQYPEAHYIQDRRYIAWLCEECADDPALRRWFADRVGRSYPSAEMVQAPAAPEEAPFVVPPGPVGPIRADRSSWAGVAIGDTPIRKGPPPIAGTREDSLCRGREVVTGKVSGP